MRVLVRWLFLLALIGVAVTVVFTVRFEGRTLWQRLQGGTGERSEPYRPAPAEAAVPPAGTKGTDRLTADDRRKLDQLLESKLQETGKSSATP